MKLCIVDIDGVIADSTARFAKAEEAKAALLQKAVWAISDATDLYWRTALSPEYVHLDTLIDGVPEAIDQICKAEYQVIFLTSRPESMRQATVDWIRQTNLRLSAPWIGMIDRLVMKPASQQYVKTVTWKSGVVELLCRLFNVSDLLFVDDETAIKESIAALPLPCTCATSLAEAVARLEEKV